MSGIFRDVYLFLRPKDRVRDYTVTTPVDFEKDSAQVRISWMRWEGHRWNAPCMTGKRCLHSRRRTRTERFPLP